jgi:hypothetical protein
MRKAPQDRPGSPQDDKLTHVHIYRGQRRGKMPSCRKLNKGRARMRSPGTTQNAMWICAKCIFTLSTDSDIIKTCAA